jgi:hypothetical protein
MSNKGESTCSEVSWQRTLPSSSSLYRKSFSRSSRLGIHAIALPLPILVPPLGACVSCVNEGASTSYQNPSIAILLRFLFNVSCSTTVLLIECERQLRNVRERGCDEGGCLAGVAKVCLCLDRVRVLSTIQDTDKLQCHCRLL